MLITVVGAGPTGSAASLLLARAGHEVTLVDRDPGPRDAAAWGRVGVMQFHLPQGLRAPGRLCLEQRLPDVHAALLEAGGVLSDVPPGAPPFAAGMHIRRSVMERVLWRSVDQEPDVRRLVGHVDEVLIEDGVVTGMIVDGAVVTADLVIDASGRAGRISADYRPPASERVSAFAYAAREYQLLPGAEPGPLNGGPGLVVPHDGFVEMVFLQDAGTFQTLLIRCAEDKDLAALRLEPAHTLASATLPGLSAWTDPRRAVAIGPVRAGAGLVNRYQPQACDVVGLLAIGDATLITNPMGARGLSLGLLGAAALNDIVATAEPQQWALDLDHWSAANLQPWFDDHCATDHTILTRWRHEPVDAGGPIGWDVVGDAAGNHPEWMPTLGPYFGMFALPPTIEPVRDQVRAMIRNGWQPPTAEGLTRDQLVAALKTAARTAA